MDFTVTLDRQDMSLEASAKICLRYCEANNFRIFCNGCGNQRQFIHRKQSSDLRSRSHLESLPLTKLTQILDAAANMKEVAGLEKKIRSQVADHFTVSLDCLDANSQNGCQACFTQRFPCER